MTADLSAFVPAQLADAAALLGNPVGNLPAMLDGLPPVLACQLVLEVVEMRRRVEVLADHVRDAAGEAWSDGK